MSLLDSKLMILQIQNYYSLSCWVVKLLVNVA